MVYCYLFGIFYISKLLFLRFLNFTMTQHAISCYWNNRDMSYPSNELKRSLHRIIMTKKELFKFRLVENEVCSLCLRPDSIEHTFLDCTVATAFYLKAISWFNHENDTDITLSNKQITFNDIPRLTHLTDYLRRRLHLFVIVLKQYIYACKCLDKKPNMQEFQRKAIVHWQIENCSLP